MAQIGYVRVSTAVQDGALQRDALAKAGCKIACNNDPLRGENRVQFRPLLALETALAAGLIHVVHRGDPRAAECPTRG